VLAQVPAVFEVVVADDGSSDDTVDRVEAIGDHRVRVIGGPHRGPSAARNRGVWSSTGTHVLFLDSDDEALPGWSAAFSTYADEDDVGLICCGGEDGTDGTVVLPRMLGPEFLRVNGAFLAGQFCVRRDVFERVGGFSESVPYGENSELAMRLIPACVEMGLRTTSIPEPLVRRYISRSESRQLFEARFKGASEILRLHEQELAREPRTLSDYFAVAGVNAMKVGCWRDGRSLLWRSTRITPWRGKTWLRWCASWLPGVPRIVWGVLDDDDVQPSRPTGAAAR
jgi:hypothetical protein